MRHLELVLLFVTLFSVRCSCAAPRSIVPVQVVVSTLSRFTPFAIDITVDSGGYIVYVSRDLNSVYRLMHNGSSILLAGSGSSATGTANAVGSNARFYYPYGITCDVVRNIAYVSDFYNYQIRAVDLNSNGVTTLAGSAFGYFDASGTQAQFRYPNGIVYHALSGAVYVADYAGNYYTKGYIRKVVIASAVVTTLLNYDCFRLTINSHGSLIYITAPYEIVQFNVTSGAITQLAGNGVGYFSGGVGLNTPNAVSLIEDESALLFSDSGNNIIRRLDIATKNVTTVAGSGVAGSFDGLGLNASFSGPIGGTHYCNTSSNMCGFLVADFVTGMIRFVANALLTRSVALSAEITASESHKGTSSHTPTRSPNHFSVPSSLGHSMSSSGRATASCVSGTSTISNTLTSKSPTFQFPKTGSYSFASTQSASSSPSKLHSRSFTSSCSQTRTFTLTASRVVTLSRQTSSLSASTSAIITSSPIPSGSASVPHLSSTLSCSETATFSLSFPNSMSTSVSQSESASPTTTVSFSNDRISPSSSIYCALVPANNARSVGGLMALAESSSSYVTIIPESTVNVSLTSQSLERGILLLPSKFALNLSLQLGGTIRGGPVNGWALVSVLLNVLSTDALFPLLTDSLSFTVNSTNVVDREQTLVIVLQPPRFSAKDPRWLPTSLSTFRTVTLHITLLLRCPTDPNVTSDVIVIVPCPGELQPLASEVKSAGIAAQFLSFFSGLGAGSSVSRLVAVRKLVLCSSDSAIQGLLPFSPTSCGDDIVASDARGNVLGNVVLWISGCSFIVFVVLGYASLAHVSWRNAVDTIGVPSQLFPLVLVTVPSTVSAAMVLSHSTACAINIVVAAAAFLMCLLPVVMLCVVAYYVPRHLTLVSRSNEVRTTDFSSTGSILCSSSIVASSVAIVLKSIFFRNARWVEMPQHPTQLTNQPLKFWRWSRITTVVILEYTVIWYACLDLAVVTTASFLGAVGILGSDVACQASAIVVLLLYVGQLILCAIIRPFTTLLSHVYALLTLALGTVTVACQAWYLFAATETSNANLDLLRQVLTAAAICDLLVSGLSMLRMLLDAFEVLKACRRLFLKRNKHRTLDSSKSNDGNDDTLLLPHMCMSLEPEGPFLLDEAKLVDDCGDWSRSNASVDDGLVVSNGTDVEGETSTYYDPFWNFDGSAVVANADYSHVRRIATAREEVELDQRHRLIESLH